MTGLSSLTLFRAYKKACEKRNDLAITFWRGRALRALDTPGDMENYYHWVEKADRFEAALIEKLTAQERELYALRNERDDLVLQVTDLDARLWNASTAWQRRG